ncbi:hypothetical protein ACLOJK_023013, partial [Asimina triloba]
MGLLAKFDGCDGGLLAAGSCRWALELDGGWRTLEPGLGVDGQILLVGVDSEIEHGRDGLDGRLDHGYLAIDRVEEGGRDGFQAWTAKW